MANPNLKRNQILAYIKEERRVSQPAIIEEFMKRFDYTDPNSARVSIGRMLKILETDGHIVKEKSPNPSSGSIEVNIWSPV